MLLRTLSRALTLLATLSLATACPGQGDEPLEESYCNARCESYDACEIAELPNLRQCKRDCLQATFTNEARQVALPLLAECYLESSCDDLEGCYDSVVAELEPAGACRSFCEARVESGCSASLSVDSCQEDACLWGSGVIAQASECMNMEACADQVACISAVLTLPSGP